MAIVSFLQTKINYINLYDCYRTQMQNDTDNEISKMVMILGLLHQSHLLEFPLGCFRADTKFTCGKLWEPKRSNHVIRPVTIYW